MCRRVTSDNFSELLVEDLRELAQRSFGPALCLLLSREGTILVDELQGVGYHQFGVYLASGVHINCLTTVKSTSSYSSSDLAGAIEAVVVGAGETAHTRPDSLIAGKPI